jgi:hypothetical protein
LYEAIPVWENDVFKFLDEYDLREPHAPPA